MKKFASALILSFLVFSNAQARQFYTACLEGKLYYSNMLTPQTYMGSVKGFFSVADDGTEAWLEVQNRPIPLYSWSFKAYDKTNPSKNWGLSLQIGSQDFVDVLKASNQTASYKYRVDDLINRYSKANNQQSGPITVKAHYFEDDSIFHHSPYCQKPKDSRLTTVQIHDNQSPESLHYQWEFCKQFDLY